MNRFDPRIWLGRRPPRTPVGGRVLITLAILSWAAPAVQGGQRLIGPGDEWGHLDAASIAPGDEIVLMPGRHRHAVLRGLTGTPTKPIIVRSLSPDRPATIDAEREGLRLEGVRHVVVRDLRIEGATINGITIAPPSGHAPDAEPWQASLRIVNVTVARTGPTGKRHGIEIGRVSDVVIDQCSIEGWGGAGIDVTASRDVQVTQCTFRGLDDHAQRSAVHVRGGTNNVRIADCTLEHAGLYPIMLGGAADSTITATGEIVEPRREGGPDGPPYDASDVQVLRCVVRGGGCPLHFLSAADCRVRNLTIVDPEHGVVAIDVGEEVGVPSTRLRIGQSLVVWEPQRFDRPFRTGPGFDPSAMTLDANLWWSPSAEGPRELAWPTPLAGPQVMDVDPRLDADLAPQTVQAALYGAFAP